MSDEREDQDVEDIDVDVLDDDENPPGEGELDLADDYTEGTTGKYLHENPEKRPASWR